MTVTLTEREAILRKMTYIEDERENLWKSYEGCLDRLRELDEIDRLATKVVPTQNTLKSLGIERLTEKEVESVKEWKDDITKVTLTPSAEKLSVRKTDNYTEPAHKEGQSLGEYLEENKTTLPVIEEDKPKYNSEVEAFKDIEYKNRKIKNPAKRGSQNDMRVVAQFAKVILKDSPVPLKAKELIQKLEEADLKLNAPYEALKAIRQYEPSIQKAGFGYYQYVPVHSKSL